MLLSETLEHSLRVLADAGIDAAHEAEFLVSAAAGVPRSRLFFEGGREVGDPNSGILGEWLRRRVSGEPIQYILGAWDFYGREFRLTRDTLIPRPETEGLVERIVARWRERAVAKGRILDVGTGSGAIAVTLAAELPDVFVIATDISGGALAVARDNARRHGVAGRIDFVASNGYCALKSGILFDLVVSNPPYVAETERESLPETVRRFEPESALFAGPDGLRVLRQLVAGAERRLVAGGELWCEIGETQAESVANLSSGSLRFLGILKDLAGRDRIAHWQNEPQGV